MATRFDSLTMAKLRELIVAPKDYAQNAAYYRGDHWQATKGWAGPIPVSADAAMLMAEIERAFVSENKIAETVNRHASGVMGREPIWGLTVRRALAEQEQPNATEQALIDEAEAVLTAWWDTRGIHRTLQQLVQTALWAGRSALRFYVPPELLTADGESGELRSDATTTEEALALIWLDMLDPAAAIVYTSPRSRQDIGIYGYELEADDLPPGSDEPRQRLELTYLDRPGPGDPQANDQADGRQRLTVLEVAWGDGQGSREGIPPVRMPLGEHLLMAQLELELMVTDAVKSQQKLLNLAWTMMSRNVVMGGFLERIILDAQVPGYWEKDSSVPGGQRFVEAPLRLGPGATAFIQGRLLEDEQGKPFLDPQGRPVVSTPQYIRNEPVRVETFTATAAAANYAILGATHQLHTLISGDAAASGESRRQAMADFLSGLLTSAGRINIIGRWLIETTLAFAAYLSGKPGRYRELRATFACRIDPGPIPADELRLVLERVDKKLLSGESGMELTGVDDVEAEKARLAAEAEEAQQRALAIIAAQGRTTPAPSTPEQGSGSTTNPQGGDDDA